MLDRYRIFETDPFLGDLDERPPEDRGSLIRKLRVHVYPQLRAEPHFGPQIKKLRGWRPDTWRYRIGNWRCFYEIDEKERLVLMTALARRSERTYSI